MKALKNHIIRLKILVKGKVKNKAVLAILKPLYTTLKAFFYFCIGDVATAQNEMRWAIVWVRNNYFKSSIFIFENEIRTSMLFPKNILDKTIEMAHPQTVLDLGCGVGKSLDYFISKGIDTLGVEGSSLAISEANNSRCILKFDLSKELNLRKKYDLIWSFEFVEHIHPNYINNLMKTFENHSNTVIMSAAQPFQGGDGHFNEQPQAYWVEQFKRHGYEFNIEKTEELRNIDERYSKNMYVFERKS